MISQTAEYALRAMVYLAMNSSQSHTVEEISQNTKVPCGYLSKVLQALRKASLVASQRGLGGGFLLAKSVSELTILEIINAVDPIQRIYSCPLELKTHGRTLCSLHKRLDNAMREVEKAFASTSLEEILENPTRSIPLCESRK